MLVSAQHGVAAPAHQVHHDPFVDALEQEDGRGCVPRIVQSDVAYVSGYENLFPYTEVGPRVDGRALRLGEYQTGFCPFRD